MMWIHPDQDEVEQVSEVKHDLTDREDKPSRDQLSPAEMKPTQVRARHTSVFYLLHVLIVAVTPTFYSCLHSSSRKVLHASRFGHFRLS